MADTAVSVQTIVDNSICRAKDPNKNTWADAEMLIYTNKARAFIYDLLIKHQSEIGITAGTITMTATQEYTLSGNLDDFWVMAAEGVYFDAGEKPLTPVGYTDKTREGATTTDDLPTMFYLTATALGLINIPTATAVAIDNTLNCRYFKYQADLALDDNMPWKNIFNQAISFFMDSIAMIRNEVNSSAVAAIYNELEKNVIEIIKMRSGKGVVA